MYVVVGLGTCWPHLDVRDLALWLKFSGSAWAFHADDWQVLRSPFGCRTRHAVSSRDFLGMAVGSGVGIPER